MNPVVCVNRFVTDTSQEIAIVKRAAEAAGARCAVSNHWEKGGDGALELADAVLDACREENGAARVTRSWRYDFRSRMERVF